jgi:hypothetical protein
MKQIAIVEKTQQQNPLDWMEKVSDEQYQARSSAD